MDEQLKQLLEEHNQLLQENLELTRKNSKKIKRIHAYMRRTFVAKLMYWLVIILVTVGAFYYVQPYINRALTTYQTLSDQLESTSGYLSNPSSLIPGSLNSDSLLKNTNVLKDLFGGNGTTLQQ